MAHQTAHDLPTSGQATATECPRVAQSQLSALAQLIGMLNLYSFRAGVFTADLQGQGAVSARHVGLAMDGAQRDLLQHQIVGQAVGTLMERYHLVVDCGVKGSGLTG